MLKSRKSIVPAGDKVLKCANPSNPPNHVIQRRLKRLPTLPRVRQPMVVDNIIDIIHVRRRVKTRSHRHRRKIMNKQNRPRRNHANARHFRKPGGASAQYSTNATPHIEITANKHNHGQHRANAPPVVSNGVQLIPLFRHRYSDRRQSAPCARSEIGNRNLPFAVRFERHIRQFKFQAQAGGPN